MENRLPPPLLTLAIAVMMWFAAAEGAASSWRTAVAIMLFLVASAFGVPAIRSFRRAGTTIDPVRVDRASVLVTGGVYRITRNPMYVSLGLMLTAWAAWLGGLWVWIGPLALVLWLDRFQIRPEERAMEARFGPEYARYRDDVRRWI